MSTDPSREHPNAAVSYETSLVPALMAEWAPRLANAAELHPGQRVLDVACGTGILTRVAARRLAPSDTIVGLDLDREMLRVAARTTPEIQWLQASAEQLPFADQAFDAVVSQFGLMFVPSPAVALREMWRVLSPGGHLVVAVWASLADTPAYAAELELIARLAGPDAAHAMRSPFVLGDRAQVEALCREAGIEGAEVDLQEGTGHFPSIRALIEADVRDWLPTMGISLPHDLIDQIVREAETQLLPFVTLDARGVTFASPALIIRARSSSRG